LKAEHLGITVANGTTLVADMSTSGIKESVSLQKKASDKTNKLDERNLVKKIIARKHCRQQHSYCRIKTKYSLERYLSIFSFLKVSFCLQCTKIFYRSKRKHYQLKLKRNHI